MRTKVLITFAIVSTTVVSVGSLVAQAHADDSNRRESTPASTATSRSASALGEVIVTAQKRGEENLQEVPIPVSVLGTDELVSSNQLRLQDYFTSVPGLNLSTDSKGGAIALIRGLKDTDFGSPTVGILVDDVPYTLSTANGYGWSAPDIDPGNLARIEVLRGPQGTLYGASGMGGLLKYVTVDPTTDVVSGRVQIGTTSVDNGDGLGYSLRANMNVPVNDSVAIRASGFNRREAGYIDNHLLGDPAQGIQEGVNQIEAHGGQLSALWRPSDRLALKLSALLQQVRLDGSPYVTPDVGDLQQSSLANTGWSERDSRLYSATLKAKLGRVDLTSSSGYSDNPFSASYDLSHALSSLADLFFGVPGAPAFADSNSKKFSQEIRLSAPIGEQLEWFLGAFYTYEKFKVFLSIPAVDPVTRASPGFFLVEDYGPAKYEEYAAFANLTVSITERFDFQIGGRQSHQWQSFGHSISGVLVGDPSGNTFLSLEPKGATDDAFTYSFVPRLKLSPDLMMYARVASGYRPGGSNGATAILFGFPPEFAPDKTLNYELGIKGNLPEDVLSFDVSLYHIDWKDIQTGIVDPNTSFGYTANVGQAKSQGLEVSVQSKPLTGLRVAAWGAWNDAVLTRDFPAGAVPAVSGDRLPYSSRFSGNLSADQEFQLTHNVVGVIGGTVSYTGDRLGNFGSERQTYPAYAKIDIRAAAQYDTWAVNVFVMNITDKRAAIAGGSGSVAGVRNFMYIQPRTIGMSVSRQW